MKIKIGNKKRETSGEYIGRPSPLGNPFFMESEADRNRVCEKYETWLNEKISSRDQTIMNELDQLLSLSLREEGVILLCWCHPKRCHAESIKNALVRLYESKEKNQ